MNCVHLSLDIIVEQDVQHIAVVQTIGDCRRRKSFGSLIRALIAYQHDPRC